LNRPEARNCCGEDFNEEIVGRWDEMAAGQSIPMSRSRC